MDELTTRLAVSPNDGLRHFDPRIHRTGRWEQIAAYMVSITRPQQDDYLSGAAGVSAFKELLSLRSMNAWMILADGLTGTASLTEAVSRYELLLHEDFTAGGGGQASHAVIRKQSGSFYTPDELAVAAVRVACEAYVASNLGIQDFTAQSGLQQGEKRRIVAALASAKVLDPTCGAGPFLVAYVDFVCGLAHGWLKPEEALEQIRAVPGNLWGVDVDPIALGLARLAVSASLSKHLGSGADLQHLGHHLVLGNLLLSSTDSYSEAAAIRAISLGDIYSKELRCPTEIETSTFDLVLGNPPWDKIRIDERAFLEHLHAGIDAGGTTKSERAKMREGIAGIAPAVLDYLGEMQQSIGDARASICADSRFTNSAHGELNTCALFLELTTRLLHPDKGVSALLVKTSTLTHYANRRLFSYLLKQRVLSRVFDFSNASRLFRIDGRERFALVILAPRSESLTLAVNRRTASEIGPRHEELELTYADLQLLNPDTGMLPLPKSTQAFALLKRLHAANPAFRTVYPDAKFGRLVHLTMHADIISKQGGEQMLGVYEGKFIDQYDGSYSTFDGIPAERWYVNKASARKTPAVELRGEGEFPVPRYFIHRRDWERLSRNYRETWSLFWRSTTSASNSRTCIATILPSCPAIQSLQMLQLPGSDANQLMLLVGTMNSKVFDFIIRNKLSGIDLTQALINQAPVPSQERLAEIVSLGGRREPVSRHLVWRVAMLLSNDPRLSLLLNGLDIPKATLDKTRGLLKEEIDQLSFIAYGLSEHDRHIIERDFISKARD